MFLNNCGILSHSPLSLRFLIKIVPSTWKAWVLSDDYEIATMYSENIPFSPKMITISKQTESTEADP